MEFTCPECGKPSEVYAEDLPELACDITDWECPKCGEITKIGWYAEVEER